MKIPKDFQPRKVHESFSTQPDTKDKTVWIVEGTANHWGYEGTPQRKGGGRGWENIGYEFDTKAEAEAFYKEHSK